MYYALTNSTEDLAIRFTYPIPDHDVSVNLEVPSFLSLGETTILNTTVTNRGLNNETDVKLQLWLNGMLVANETYPSLLSWASMTLSHPWTSPQPGTYNVTTHVLPVENENSTTINNAETKFVTVVDPSLKIGFIYTHEERKMPSLKIFYEGLGFSVDEIYSSITETLLSNYHIIFVSESYYGTEWNAGEIAILENWMQNGGTLVGIGSNHLADFEQLAAIHGITFIGEPVGIYGPTTVIDSSHPLMNGITLLYLSSPLNALNVLNPAIPIFWDATGAGIYGAAVSVGFGQFYVIADYFLTYACDNEILLENILTRQRFDHDLCASLEAPTRLQPNEMTLLNVTVFNLGLNNETNVELQLFINDMLVDSQTYSSLSIGTSKAFSYSWTPSIEGIYNISAYIVPKVNEMIIYNNRATNFIKAINYICKIILLYTKYKTDAVHVGDLLLNYGIQYDLLDVSSYVPTLSEFINYPVVFVWTSSEVDDSVGLGNVLADYITAGRAVVVSSCAFPDPSSFLDGGIKGRFTSYSPFVVGYFCSFEREYYGLSTHEIFSGVRAISSSFGGYGSIAKGASLVASWSDGNPFVAIKDRVIGIIAYPCIESWKGDLDLVWVNSILYLINYIQTSRPKIPGFNWLVVILELVMIVSLLNASTRKLRHVRLFK
ncbi:MAG: CARDB domain-containing protein [Promethearchaeota archaeon]